ncbi:hypothetical protein [Rufibacter roseus]|uniref:Uncharacterized protein n=1 Tax=Rufibacter roseus TaxID=1567108 RepID=A0ABW2DPJ0_9BACT|nr:hypothetical protein [Rufibacter roseus]
MNILKSIFGNTNKTEEEVPEEFQNWVRKSILLIGKEGKEMEDKELQSYLIEHGIPKQEAVEILLFLPTAFCRKLKPSINWSTEYIDHYSDNRQIKRKLVENKRYQLIQIETDNYWNSSSDFQIKLALAGRSPEYKSVQHLLENGSMPENIRVSEPIIIR